MNLESTTLYVEMIEAARVFIYYFRGQPKQMAWPQWLLKLKIDLNLRALLYQISLHKAREQGRVGQHGRYF